MERERKYIKNIENKKYVENKLKIYGGVHPCAVQPVKGVKGCGEEEIIYVENVGNILKIR